MENNFYVGTIIHRKKNSVSSEKLVLYTTDNINYTDLITDNVYTTNSNNKYYLLENSLIPIDIDDFKIDYNYLLDKHNNPIKHNKIRRINKIKNYLKH